MFQRAGQKNKIYFWERIAFRVSVGFVLPVFVSAYALHTVSNRLSDLGESKERTYRMWGSVQMGEGRALLALTKMKAAALSFGPATQGQALTVVRNEMRQFQVDVTQSRRTVERIAQDSGVAIDPQLPKLFGQVIEGQRTFAQVFDRMGESARTGGDLAGLQRELARATQDIEQTLGKLRAANELFELKVQTRIQAAEAEGARTLALALLAVFFFGAVTAIVVSMTITVPIQSVLRRVRDIATGDGDLTKRVNSRAGGEVKELAEWVNVFLDKTHAIIRTIANGSRVISAATEQVSHHTRRTSILAAGINKTIMEQSMNLDECTSSLGSIDDLIQSSGESTRQAASLSKIAMDRALQGGASVQETIEAMEKIADSAKKVEQLVISINEIASQTNLLAINAAIEATKAGEHGKGFAVVAEEVRKLAERSRKLTAEVTALIGESSGRVKAGVNLAKGAGVSLGGIIKDVEAVSSLIQRVAASAMKQTESSASVLQSLQKVSDAVRTNLKEMQEVNRGAELTTGEVQRLDALVGQLNSIVGQFRLGDEGDTGLPIAGSAPGGLAAMPASALADTYRVDEITPPPFRAPGNRSEGEEAA